MMLWTGHQTTQRMHRCQLEHSNFFHVLDETHSQVCVSQDDNCLLFCCGQTATNIQTVAGSLKTVCSFLQPALPGRSLFMRATGWACLLVAFAFDIFLLSVFYWHLFDFWPYLRGFQNQFGFKPCLPVGNGIRWLVDKMIIYLSLGTKRVVNLGYMDLCLTGWRISLLKGL